MTKLKNEFSSFELKDALVRYFCGCTKLFDTLLPEFSGKERADLCDFVFWIPNVNSELNKKFFSDLLKSNATSKLESLGGADVLNNYYNFNEIDLVIDASGFADLIEITVFSGYDSLNYIPFFKSGIFCPDQFSDGALVATRTAQYFPVFFSSINFSKNSIFFTLYRTNELLKILKFFKSSNFFKSSLLIDLFAVDFLVRHKRYELTYSLISLWNSRRIYLRIYVSGSDLVPSVASLYNSANWLEREAWDLYGIFFISHPDLRRILTDYGFLGHPLRKNFPLTGFWEVRYDDTARRVVSSYVELLQELRLFFFGTSWRGN